MIKRTLVIILLAFFVFSLNTLALGTDSGEINIKEISSSDILGDINLDDELNAQDITIMRKNLLGIETDSHLRQTVLLDVNNDGKFNIIDLVRIKKLLANSGKEQ